MNAINKPPITRIVLKYFILSIYNLLANYISIASILSLNLSLHLYIEIHMMINPPKIARSSTRKVIKIGRALLEMTPKSLLFESVTKMNIAVTKFKHATKTQNRDDKQFPNSVEIY